MGCHRILLHRWINFHASTNQGRHRIQEATGASQFSHYRDKFRGQQGPETSEHLPQLELHGNVSLPGCPDLSSHVPHVPIYFGFRKTFSFDFNLSKLTNKVGENIQYELREYDYLDFVV